MDGCRPARSVLLSLFTTSFAIRIVQVPVRTATRRARATPAQVRDAASRARHAPVRSRRRLRVPQLLLGLLLVGLGVGLLIQAQLGVASWDVLHVGLADRTGLSIGAIAAMTAVAAAGAAWWLGERPRAGALVPVLVVAPTIDVAVATVTTPEAFGQQLVMLLTGMVVLSVGVGAYIASDHGAGPADLVFLAIARRGVPVWAARLLVDGSLVGLGWLVGGPVGIGTVIITAGLAPMIGLTIATFDLEPARTARARRDQDLHRELGWELQLELEGR